MKMETTFAQWNCFENSCKDNSSCQARTAISFAFF